MSDAANTQSSTEANLDAHVGLRRNELTGLDPENLSVEFYLYQKQFLAFAQRVEQELKGGILADEMGLGKTIQAIGLMDVSPPPFTENKEERRPNLVVTVAGIMHQWKREIMDKCNAGRFKVLIYHGNERKGMTAAKLRMYDIIITAYSTVATEGTCLCRRL